MILRLLPLLMAFGTTWSVSNTTTTKTVPLPTNSTTPEAANPSAVLPKCPSPLCDGFECGEGEYCSTNNGLFSPRCRPCTLVAYSCSDMDVVRTRFKGCETFCFNSQTTSLIKNCSIEKEMLSEDLSRCTSKVSNAGLETKTQQNETSALQLRVHFLEKEVKAQADTLKYVVAGLCATFLVVLCIVVVIFCCLLIRLKNQKATSIQYQGECGENQGYSAEQLRKGKNDEDILDIKQDADKHLGPPQTLTKSVVGGSPTEEVLSGHNNRNHLAPTGNRTEYVHGDQNDFLSTNRQTMTSSAHNNDTDPRGEDSMTSSSDNVSNSGDSDPQWSGYTSNQEDSLKAKQPLLPKTSLPSQPEQERHNSEYKFGSNPLLNKVHPVRM